MSYTLNYRGAKIDELLGQVDEQFIAEYNVALYADITAAIAAGKQVLLKKDNALYPYIGQDATSAYTFAMMDEDAILQLFTVSTASVWATVSKALQEELTFDAAPTDGSTNPVTSDGIYDAIEEAKSEIATSEQPGMTVGASDNLISDAKINSNSPYLYRPVINGVGNRAYSKLIGATIAHNQLVLLTNSTGTCGGLAYTSSSDGYFYFTNGGTGGSSAQVTIGNFTPKAGHKYYLKDAFYQQRTGGNAWKANLNDTTMNEVISAPSVAEGDVVGVNIYVKAGETYTTKKYYPQVSDLTQDFGSTIADYAYTLEQGEAGAGIAWLKSYGFFGKYAPYDAGSLISTKAEKKKVVGFNLWDEEWEVGGINSSSGQNADAITNRIRSKNYIPVFPYTNYYCVCPTDCYVFFYDENKQYLSRYVNYAGQVFGTITAHYIRICPIDTYGTTYKNDICINLSKTTGSPKNGDYVKHTSQEYDLGSDELRGLFKLDANNNIVAGGDIKTSDGTITRKYGTYTFTGSETYADTYPRTNGDYYCTFNILTNAKANGNGISSNGVEFVDPTTAYGGSGTYFALRDSTRIGVYVAGASSAADVMAWLTTNKPTVIFELATPTTEQGTPFIDPSIVYPNGTEEYIDTRTVPVPVGNETEYTEDLKGGLETILDTPSANGTYVLKATVSGGVATLFWVSE